jgi:hypothetical protein
MWTALELAERFGLPVQGQGVDLVRSGSSGWIGLEADPGFGETISVIKILRRRGVSIKVGKPAVEDLFDNGYVRVLVEHIDDALEGDLRACKVRMRALPAEAAAE